MVFLVVGAWFGLSCLLLFLLRGFRCFPFFFSFSEEARHAAWFFFLNYSPGREERCWEGLQCEICSGRARAEAAYEWVAVFGRCSMLPRTFYMNGVCLSALCDQERQRCCVAADFPGDLFVFFFCYFIDLHLNNISFTVSFWSHSHRWSWTSRFDQNGECFTAGRRWSPNRQISSKHVVIWMPSLFLASRWMSINVVWRSVNC